MAYSKAKIEMVVVYLSGLAPGWIKIWSSKSGAQAGLLEVGHGADIEADHPTLAAFDTLWFEKEAHANLVFEQALVELGADPESPILLPATGIRDLVVNVSGNLGAQWQTTQEVVGKAGIEVDSIERQVEALNKSGGLRPLNKKYKTYRLAMQRTGEGAMSYSDYLQFFKVKVAKLVGQNVAAGIDKFTGLSAIAPTLMSAADDAIRALPVLRNTAALTYEHLDDIPKNSVRRHNGAMRPLKV